MCAVKLVAEQVVGVGGHVLVVGGEGGHRHGVRRDAQVGGHGVGRVGRGGGRVPTFTFFPQLFGRFPCVLVGLVEHAGRCFGSTGRLFRAGFTVEGHVGPRGRQVLGPGEGKWFVRVESV